MQEFFQDFTAFIVPDSPHFDCEPFLPFLPRLNPGIYFIWDLISEITFSNRSDLKGLLKKYYYNLFGPETIETVLGFIANDQNASKAAKNLYMHRNTLNYRLDHFIKTSEIDVRGFKGAVAMFLLFRK
jgi:DNA-binding PucR family transcriptional regulator